MANPDSGYPRLGCGGQDRPSAHEVHLPAKTIDTAGVTASNKPYAVADTADSGAPTAKGGLIGSEAARSQQVTPVMAR
jgi:hypothetical protein